MFQQRERKGLPLLGSTEDYLNENYLGARLSAESQAPPQTHSEPPGVLLSTCALNTFWNQNRPALETQLSNLLTG